MLQGKRALITGSTSGIGLGIAHKLAAQGSDLILNGFGDPQTIEQLRTELAATYGVWVDFEAADLTRPIEIEALAQRCLERGPVDILINNAGIQHVSPLETFPPERWDAVIALNLSAAFHTSRLLLPGMRNRNWGRIINIASAHGLVASIEKAAYVAAKHGIIGLTKVTALETARSPITANAICPGWVDTDMARQRFTELGIDAQQARSGVPTGLIVTPQEVADMVLYLCSPAARNVTGQALALDGGSSV